MIRGLLRGRVPKQEETTLIYFILAKEFGWTPQQVDSIEYDLIGKLVILIDEAKKIEKEEIERARKNSVAGRHSSWRR